MNTVRQPGAGSVRGVVSLTATGVSLRATAHLDELAHEDPVADDR